MKAIIYKIVAKDERDKPLEQHFVFNDENEADKVVDWLSVKWPDAKVGYTEIEEDTGIMNYGELPNKEPHGLTGVRVSFVKPNGPDYIQVRFLEPKGTFRIGDIVDCKPHEFVKDT